MNIQHKILLCWEEKNYGGLRQRKRRSGFKMCHKVYSDQDSGIGLQDQEEQECWKDPKKGFALHSLRKGLNASKSQRHIIMSSTMSLSDGSAMHCDIEHIKNDLDHICHATADSCSA